MFRTRVISSIFLVAIALVTILLGGPVLILTVLFISLVGMQELYNAMGIEKFTVLPVMGFIGAAGYDAVIYFCPEPYYLVGVVASLTIILMTYVFTFPRYIAEEVMTVFFGVVYVAVMLGFIYVTRMGYEGKILVWLIFLSSWGADTCAYLVGRKLGKHKMAPVLSPKKSVEGAVGGVVGAGLMGLAFGLIFKEPYIRYMIICAAGALISMVGDLAASAIKRDKGIKDYGKLIPGHGGILDRFDSVIFTAPVIYFLSLLLIGTK